MGAESRIGFIKKENGDTARSAYSRAYDQACFEEGNGGYTGSMAESSGYFEVRTAPMLQWEASSRAEFMMDKEIHKWGPTAMIPVGEVVNPRTITLEVDVTTTKGDWDKTSAAVLAAVKAKLKPGEQIQSLRQDQGKSEHKIVSKTTPGATVSKFVVRGSRGFGEAPSFATLIEAKAGAKAILERDPYCGDVLKIEKVTVRESGIALATVARVPVKITQKVTAVVGKPGTTVIGWVCAGIYSS